MGVYQTPIAVNLAFLPTRMARHRNQSINRKRAYILAGIHGMDHFCPKLASQPYNKLESCVSKIHTPMVMVWFGNV
jgi:hypothetical protein